MSRGIERPPVWAVVVMVVGIVAFAAMGFLALNRPSPPPATGQAATEEPTGTDSPTRILAIGDSYTGGSDEGGKGATGWPQLVAADLGVVVDVRAAGGSGYVTVGPSGASLRDLAEQPGGPYDVVVFFGSRNDQPSSPEVQTNAEAAFQAARASSPDARLIVIGPPWVNASVPDFITADRDAVHAAAEAVGATWVDPLQDGWFFDRPDLIGSDGVHPTDAGHRYMADRIKPVIEPLVTTPTS